MFRKCRQNFNPYFNNRKDIFGVLESNFFYNLLLQDVYCPTLMHMRFFLYLLNANMIQKFSHMLKVLCILKKWPANYQAQTNCRYSRCF